jgi:pimeloyl-ACP methyl ester carboxylesterase
MKQLSFESSKSGSSTLTGDKTGSEGRVKSGYAPLGNLRMYYEIHGEGGMPLVLIHGGGSTIPVNFGFTLPLFASDRQVIAVEMPAHGRTRDTGEPITFKKDADYIAALLKYLGIAKADVFGFSNGGHTTIEIGIRHPEIVNKLVIASAFYRRDGAFAGFWDGFRNATLDMMPPQLKAAYLQTDPDPEHLQVMFDRDTARMKEFKDWTDEEMGSIKAKTLVFCAQHDVNTVEHAVRMSKVIPGAELAVVPGTHGSYLGDSFLGDGVKGDRMAEITVALVKEFLDK